MAHMLIWDDLDETCELLMYEGYPYRWKRYSQVTFGNMCPQCPFGCMLSCIFSIFFVF